jgi:hypothetical protein
MLHTRLRRSLFAVALAPVLLWLPASVIAVPVATAEEPPTEVGVRPHRGAEVAPEGDGVGRRISARAGGKADNPASPSGRASFWPRTAALAVVLVAASAVVWFGLRPGRRAASAAETA